MYLKFLHVSDISRALYLSVDTKIFTKVHICRKKNLKEKIKRIAVAYEISLHLLEVAFYALDNHKSFLIIKNK